MQDGSKTKGVADIVFLLDISGSMQPCLDAVKTSIGTFVETLTHPTANNEIPVTDWRIKICGYRDHVSDGSNWFASAPFSRDLAEIRGHLASPTMTATGGGDEPESLLDAVYTIATMPTPGMQDEASGDQWRARGRAVRALILFTDATYKTPMTIPEAKGGTVQDVVAALMGNRVILCGFVPEWEGYLELGAADKAEIEFFATIASTPALAGLGTSSPAGIAASQASVAALNAKSADSAQFAKIMAQLAKTVSKSAAVEKID